MSSKYKCDIYLYIIPKHTHTRTDTPFTPTLTYPLPTPPGGGWVFVSGGGNRYILETQKPLIMSLRCMAIKRAVL